MDAFTSRIIRPLTEHVTSSLEAYMRFCTRSQKNHHKINSWQAGKSRSEKHRSHAKANKNTPTLLFPYRLSVLISEFCDVLEVSLDAVHTVLIDRRCVTAWGHSCKPGRFTRDLPPEKAAACSDHTKRFAVRHEQNATLQLQRWQRHAMATGSCCTASGRRLHRQQQLICCLRGPSAGDVGKASLDAWYKPAEERHLLG